MVQSEIANYNMPDLILHRVDGPAVMFERGQLTLYDHNEPTFYPVKSGEFNTIVAKSFWVEMTDILAKLHHQSGTHILVTGTHLWCFDGEMFNSKQFHVGWPDDKKAWWMRAMMEAKV